MPVDIAPAVIAVRQRIAAFLNTLPPSLSMPGLSQSLNGARVRLSPERLGSPAHFRCAFPQVVALQFDLPETGNPARAVLVLPLSLARQLIARTLNCPVPEDPRLSSGHTGALLFTIDTAAGDLIAAGLPPLRIRGMLYDLSQASDYLGEPPAVALCSALQIDDASFAVAVMTGSLPQIAPPASRLRPEEHLPSWPLPMRIQCGISHINPAALTRLRPGALLTLDVLCRPRSDDSRGANGLLLRTHGRVLPGRWLDSRRIEVLTETGYVANMKEKCRYDGSVTSPEGADISDSGAILQMEIRVEAGRVLLPLASACRLMPGAVITLAKPLDHRVELYLEDRRIARGILVRSGDELAVEIEEME